MTFLRFLLGMAGCLVMVPNLAAAEPMPAPAAFTAKARILFQGDSITDGSRGRSSDPNHILGHGNAFIIAAKYGADYPQLELDFLNARCQWKHGA